jgi:hypothetical protein
MKKFEKEKSDKNVKSSDSTPKDRTNTETNLVLSENDLHTEAATMDIDELECMYAITCISLFSDLYFDN